MIIQENLAINGKEYRKTYSDTFTIQRDGEEYDEAIDPIDSGRLYTETANPKAGVELEAEEESCCARVIGAELHATGD